MNEYLAVKQQAFNLLKDSGKTVITRYGYDLTKFSDQFAPLYDFFLHLTKEDGITKEHYSFYMDTIMNCEKSLYSLYTYLDWTNPHLFTSFFAIFPLVFAKDDKVKVFFNLSTPLLSFFIHEFVNDKELYDIFFVVRDLYEKKQFQKIRDIYSNFSSRIKAMNMESLSPIFDDSFFSEIIQPCSSLLYNSYPKEAIKDCLENSLVKPEEITQRDYDYFFLIEFMNLLRSDLHMPPIVFPSIGDLITIRNEFSDKSDKTEIYIRSCFSAYLFVFNAIEELCSIFNLLKEEIYYFFVSLCNLIDPDEPDFKLVVEEIEKFLKEKVII